MGLSKQEEREYAKMLFVNERLTYKEIALRVKVTEKTIGKWAEADKWGKLRQSLTTTRENQLVHWYNQLDAINESIKNNNYIPTPAESDMMSKITANIHRLEVETSIGEYIQVGRKVLTFIQSVNLDDAKQFKTYFDEFINAEMKLK